MKRLLLFLALASSLFAADVANDILMSQRKPDNSGNIQRNIPAQNAITSASLPSFQEAIGLGLTDSPTFAGVTANSITSAAGSGLTLATGTSGTALSFASATNIGTFTAGVNGTSLTLTSEITVPNTGIHVLDTNATHDLIFSPGSNLTADRTLSVVTGDVNRTLDMTTMPGMVKSAVLTLLTAGAPADIGTIAIPTGTTRYRIGFVGIGSGGHGIILTETSAGVLTAAALELRDAAAGAGTSYWTGSAPASTANNFIVTTGNSISVAVSSATLTVRQLVNSAAAGTITIYVPIWKLP